MSQDVKSNAELSMSAFLRDNPTYENGFDKRGQAHMMARVLNVACLLFLTQKWVLFDSLPFRSAGYVGSVLARCSRCTFRPESALTEYIPPLLFGAHSASCVSKGLAPNRKSPPVVTPVQALEAQRLDAKTVDTIFSNYDAAGLVAQLAKRSKQGPGADKATQILLDNCIT